MEHAQMAYGLLTNSISSINQKVIRIQENCSRSIPNRPPQPFHPLAQREISQGLQCLPRRWHASWLCWYSGTWDRRHLGSILGIGRVFQRFLLTSKGMVPMAFTTVENWRVDIGSIDSDRWLVEWLLELEWLVVIIDCWWCMMSNDGWKTRNSRTSASVAPNGVSSQVIIQYYILRHKAK